MLITAPVTVYSLCNYDWMTLTVTTWTNVSRDQRRPDSSSWVMTFHPPVCPLNERGFMSSAACRRPTGSLLSSTSGGKKRKSKPFFCLKSENRPNEFYCFTIGGRMPAVFLHSCDSSNETLIWLTHPSWCHGGGCRNYTPREPELYKNSPTARTQARAQEKKEVHTLKRSL